MEDEMKKSNQPQEGNQTEIQKPENIDNRLPYEKPLLRKHGKVNDGTNANVYFEGRLDGRLDYTDIGS